MALIVQDICDKLEQIAPLDLALDWDNVGLQLGSPNQPVAKVLITLTLTKAVLAEAIEKDVDLIIAHHPLIFRPLKNIRKDDPLEGLVWRLIQHNISLYVSHTNLDQAPCGLNHWLARAVQLEELQVLIRAEVEGAGLGRIGKIPAVTLAELANRLEKLWGQKVKVVGNPQQTISSVAVLGGSGGSYIKEAKEAGADVLITGDVSYHQAVDALAMGLNILDAGHFATEQIMVSEIAAYLEECFSTKLEINQETSVNPFRF